MGKTIHRGDIWYIFNENLKTGCEVDKTRPAVIVSNDLINRHAGTVEVVYLTSKDKHTIPLAVRTSIAYKNGFTITHQITSIDKSRLTTKIGTMSTEDMIRLDKALALSIGCNATANQTKELLKKIDRMQFEITELKRGLRKAKEEKPSASKELFSNKNQYTKKFEELYENIIEAYCST